MRLAVGPVALNWGRREPRVKRWGRSAGRKAKHAAAEVQAGAHQVGRGARVVGKALPWAALAGVAALIAVDEVRARRRAAARELPAQAGRASDRGRAADSPTEIPKAGWKDILWRTAREVQADDVVSVARSIAFSGMLALFPALAAFVSIYGLFADVASAREHLAVLTGFIPADALTLIGEQMVRIAAANDAGLSLTAVFGVLLSVWSANAGMKSLFRGLNIAFEEEEKRGFVALNLVTLAFTLGMVLFFAVAVAAIIALPVALEFVRAEGVLPLLAWLRWPALLALVVGALSLLYRYGPSRDRAKWRWVSYGAVAAAVLWLAVSGLFSWYLANVADYQATYGSLGAVFGFMVWLWLSSVVVLFGAELNSEIEHQTARDSTTGAPEPLGRRGATMADHVGRAAPKSLLPPAAEKVVEKVRRRDHARA
ncbi:MAG TPA: YihY/virulence factor BrkB family protein [Caulobacteraceae bacterium]|nr:YihY/virulence factor BrkB family protein [Caulobacteraceae bacterium]